MLYSFEIQTRLGNHCNDEYLHYDPSMEADRDIDAQQLSADIKGARPYSRESTTFPPLGPGYYSTRVRQVLDEKLELPLRIGYYSNLKD